MKEPKKKLLVSVNVLGSVGPIRFLANKDEKVSSVINTALKAYARRFGRIEQNVLNRSVEPSGYKTVKID